MSTRADIFCLGGKDIENAKGEKSMLFEAMNKLSDREKCIIHMRFGLCGEKERTQREVADELHISQSYISRLEKKILHQLKCEIEKIS